MEPTRPTLRALRDDLKIALPSAQVPLDEIDHPLLSKAREQFSSEDTSHERIVAVDDEILLKLKVQRWRGAVWIEGTLPWLIAAGNREEGSRDDFYATLAADAKAARARYNAEHREPVASRTLVRHLLPNQDDYDRYQLESGVRLVRRISAAVRDLTVGSLRDGHEHAADFPAFRLGILVRADDGHETYAAVRITGSVPEDLASVILRHVPGCDPASWFPEYALPSRQLLPAEQAWSTLMDPKVAAELLDDSDDAGRVP